MRREEVEIAGFSALPAPQLLSFISDVATYSCIRLTAAF